MRSGKSDNKTHATSKRRREASIQKEIFAPPTGSPNALNWSMLLRLSQSDFWKGDGLPIVP